MQLPQKSMYLYTTVANTHGLNPKKFNYYIIKSVHADLSLISVLTSGKKNTIAIQDISGSLRCRCSIDHVVSGLSVERIRSKGVDWCLQCIKHKFREAIKVQQFRVNLEYVTSTTNYTYIIILINIHVAPTYWQPRSIKAASVATMTSGTPQLIV